MENPNNSQTYELPLNSNQSSIKSPAEQERAAIQNHSKPARIWSPAENKRAEQQFTSPKSKIAGGDDDEPDQT